jgi:hypothetical protein
LLQSGKSDIETALWHRNGRLTAYYISSLRWEANGQPAMLCVGIDISGRRIARRPSSQRPGVLEKQNQALGEQARNPALRGNDLGLAFRTITEVASRTLAFHDPAFGFTSATTQPSTARTYTIIPKAVTRRV